MVKLSGQRRSPPKASILRQRLSADPMGSAAPAVVAARDRSTCASAWSTARANSTAPCQADSAYLIGAAHQIDLIDGLKDMSRVAGEPGRIFSCK
jgi:hypothetical protein